LSLAWDCQQYNALPDAGGMLDQDYGLMERMKALNAIHKSFAMWRGARGAEIHNLPAWVGQNIAYLLDIGIGVGLDG